MRHFVITVNSFPPSVAMDRCDPITTNYTTINITWTMARRGMIITGSGYSCSHKCHIPGAVQSPIVSKYLRGIHQILVGKGHLEDV